MSRTGFIQNELDLKLLVLYIMDRAVAPITFLQLLDLALCDAGVDYFSLTEAVDHLTQTDHLKLDGELYSITEKGRRNIEICQSSLPYSVRLRCDENLVKLNDTLMRQAQVQTGLQPNEDGTCTVRLYLADDAGPLMELKLISPSLAQGQVLTSKFQQSPEAIYHEIMALLNRHSQQEPEDSAQETKEPQPNPET